MATITDDDLKMFQKRARAEFGSGRCDAGGIAWDSVIWDLCHEVRRLRSASTERGDCAKLREFAELVSHMNDDGYWNGSASICALVSKAKAALAAPPRNCDRFKTKEEAATAFANENKQWIPQQVLWELAPWLDWLFVPAIDFALKRDSEVVVSKNATTTKESLEVGNAAKLREAVEVCLHTFQATDWTALGRSGRVVDLIQRCKSALAEPPRNCDVGTAREQSARFNKFCYDYRSYERCCGDCPLNGEPCCELAWAQMPYEAKEGGAK